MAYLLLKNRKDNRKENKEETKTVKEEVKEKEEVVVPAKEEATEDLSTKTLTELKTMAKNAGIKGFSTMKKDELIASLSE